MELSLGPHEDGLFMNNKIGKRSFEKAIGKINYTYKEEVSKTKVSNNNLLSWGSRQPNEEDDNKREDKKRNSCSIIYKINNDDEEENYVVGWPPIKAWRRKLLHQDQHHPHHQNRDQGRVRAVNAHNINSRSTSSSSSSPVIARRQINGIINSPYVKVKMEGVAIARMVDINLYNDYHTLRHSLLDMFAQFHKFERDYSQYMLIYQDQDGDWLLAGDVPWQSFMGSVQHLEIIRSGS